MRLFELRAKQTLAISIEEAWRFFSDPGNLAEITPPSLAFRVVGEPPARMYPGMIIRYKVSPLFGLDVDWVTEITHVREPSYFVDEQRFGPYRFWHHQHHFRSVEGGTEVEDLVTYAPPSPAGGLIDRFVVGPRLAEIFDHRRRVLADRFGEIAETSSIR